MQNAIDKAFIGNGGGGGCDTYTAGPGVKIERG